MQTAIPCTLMRGGTSKGLYFLASDMPSDPVVRDRVLLAAMGSPDTRQIDGVGGAHPLTSKVAIVSASPVDGVDVDYLFLQVVVDKAVVSDAQPCGNIMAGVGPFAIEKGLVAAQNGETDVTIRTVNNGSVCVSTVQTPDGVVTYDGDARIDGVPGTHAAVTNNYLDSAGSNCGALFPTGNVVDVIEGVSVTCIDNGMPVILARAEDLGKSGYEAPADLEKDTSLKAKVEAIRLVAGDMMNLGDVTTKTVPKISLLAAPKNGGAVNTRTFIPHRVHDAIGVLGAVSVATGCVAKGSVGFNLAELGTFSGNGAVRIDVEHPTGVFTVEMDVETGVDGIAVKRSALLRTARKLMSGEVYVPAQIWSGT